MTEELIAITPIDGRYRELVDELKEYFSEYALMKYRLKVELEYFRLVVKILKQVDNEQLGRILNDVFEKFTIEEAKYVKEIEKETRHDVEALIRYIRAKLSSYGFTDLMQLVHIGLTSEDVTNIAYSLMLRDFNEKVLLPLLKELLFDLLEISGNEKSTLMLGRTHGMPALPTTLGKEFSVYAYRFLRLFEVLSVYRFPGKISGAVGTYASLTEVFGRDALKILDEFIRKLGLEPWPVTKQTLPHDALSSFLQNLSLISGCALDLCRDLWLLTMLGYVIVKRIGIGSSTMPQKANPIEIENAEGNLELSINLLNFLSGRLQTSRLQRDLSDSTLKRNYGTAIAYLIIGIKNLLSFLRRIEFDRELMRSDVEKHPEILSEAIQVRMRLIGKNLIDELRRLETRDSAKYLENVKKIVSEASGDPELIIPKTYDDYLGASTLIVESIYKLCIDKLSKYEKS